MLVLLGGIVVLLTVWGGYVLSGGDSGALVQPYELLIIAGAAVGAFFAANSGQAILATGRYCPLLFRGPRYTRELGIDVMSLLFRLLRRARQQGIFFLETDIDSPYTSPDFLRYPLILADSRLTEFITDYLRLMLSGNMNAWQLDALMEQELETLEEEGEVPAQALGRLGDSLPAFGIVAAVLGVIHTLSAADRPAAEMGALIAQAMVGTFLGILLSYGFITPLAERLRLRHAESLRMLQCVRMILIADLNGCPPQTSVEFGRKALYSDIRPSFTEIEACIVDIRKSINTEA
ncbi:flagellar motor stator protein MotA [Kosakonia sp. S42]|uniref:flagellar motor stator protein MotA n=1 Tax=Kosakonia sp. S42 TaxID=2767458 RepID=UPI00190AB50E|nr:flagellar motor stator protein MotA [Kosakonia sp. S42]MBK0019300.1 flagellar motor stator protein MotA [Kosakonia sp. S42]